jgi:hypothetical protein
VRSRPVLRPRSQDRVMVANHIRPRDMAIAPSEQSPHHACASHDAKSSFNRNQGNSSRSSAIETSTCGDTLKPHEIVSRFVRREGLRTPDSRHRGGLEQ